MGLVSPPLLSLDLMPPCDSSPASISGWLRVAATIAGDSERLSKVDEFVGRLETELVKIQVFHRELPHCVLLLNDAIAVLKEEANAYKARDTELVLKEFIPSKKDSGEELVNDSNEDCRDKGNWLSSVQLWNVDDLSSQNQTLNQNQKHRQKIASETPKVENRWKKFPVSHDLDQQPINGYHVSPPNPSVKKADLNEDIAMSGFSLIIPKIDHPKQEMVLDESNLGLTNGGVPSNESNLSFTVQTNHHLHAANRKQRRCWSHDLHRRFVNALQQLGGAHVATPKQIREIMQVDGLTNDEVKSHLQKYRLHTKKGAAQHRNPSKASSASSGSPQSPFQFSPATSTEDEEISEGQETLIADKSIQLGLK